MTRPRSAAPTVLIALVAVTSVILPMLMIIVGAVRDRPSTGFYLAFAPAPVAFAVVGWLLATRRPDIVIGPLCLLFGFVFAVYFPIDMLVGSGSTAPALAVAAALSSASDAPAFIIVAMILILFPDGRLPGPRWRWTAVVAVVGSLASLVGFTLAPGPLAAFPGIVNPIGVDGFPGDIIGELGYVSLLLLLPAAVAALVTRWRQGRPPERAQIKWVGAASVVLLVTEAINLATFDPTDPLGSPAAGIAASVGTTLVPAAIGIAILRYRLYEIDRIVGRTLAYAIVTVLLAVAFIGTNLALQAVLADATGSSTLTTAAATLVVAALVQPLRRRVQAPIDRRFNRTHVNGERAVASFSGELRDQVDLDRLRFAIVRTADDAVAPATASVWLRSPAR